MVNRVAKRYVTPSSIMEIYSASLIDDIQPKDMIQPHVMSQLLAFENEEKK